MKASLSIVFFISALLLRSSTAAALTEECMQYLSGTQSCGLSNNACFFICHMCTDPILRAVAPPGNISCEPFHADRDATVFHGAAAVYLNVSFMQGFSWLDDAGDVEANASACLEYLLAHMPRRDILLLSSNVFHTLDFLLEHIRFALLARHTFPFARDVPWTAFLDNVLPYAFLNEKRDQYWRWRPRMFQVFSKVDVCCSRAC